eukprot:m.41865 g.41865  ORF g.41865 m.41865 type:complete len:51 (+) comp10619_c0_seq4:446-598(+)
MRRHPRRGIAGLEREAASWTFVASTRDAKPQEMDTITIQLNECDTGVVTV